MSRELVERLALSQGIQLSYQDLQGKDIFAPLESVLAALKAMGTIEDASDAAGALREAEAAAWRWWIEPVNVVWLEEGDGLSSKAAGFKVRVPESALSRAANLRVELEDGGVREEPLQPGRAKVTDSAKLDDGRWVELELPLPAGLPPGYHRLNVEAGGQEMRSWLIVAPKKAYNPGPGRAWGVFMPLYALHSRRSWGIGDYTDLRRLIEWAGDKGASVVATLPLLPTFLEQPFEPSPYQPVSRLFWSEVFIDPEAPFVDGSRPAVDTALAGQARALNDSRDVDYAAVMRLKREALETQAAALPSEHPEAHAMQAYLASRPEVSDYAAFRAAMERLGPDWRTWPERQRDGELTEQDYDPSVKAYFEYAQWRAHSQMFAARDAGRRLGMRSYLDLPVGVHQQGYDPWRHRRAFGKGVTVGAPPDLLSSNGQNWGFQPLVPRVLRESGYDYMRRYLRHYFASAGMLRVDHAIGLHRLYWIPEGASGRDGVFVRQPAEELYAVLCLESMRHRAVVVAEDLGLVPPAVRRGLDAHGIGGMYLQMFEMTGRKTAPLGRPRSNSVASFSTHDLPPFAAYWRDEDLNQREAIGLLTPERVAEEKTARNRAREALVSYLQDRGLVEDASDTGQVFRGSTALLAESDAQWLVLNLEDTWGETRAQNLPGTNSEQHANWVARAAVSLDEFEANEGLMKAVETVQRFLLADKKAGTDSVSAPTEGVRAS